MVNRPYQNWSRTFVCHPAQRPAPRDLPELQQLVRDLGRDGQPARVAGAGHSFDSHGASDGSLITLDGLSGLIEVQRSERRARVRAGTRLFDLGPALWARGLALRNMGDIDRQSLGGAISTGTHGTGRSLGCMARDVTALTLVDAQGDLHHCSAARDPALFQAARTSLGALGVVAEVELQLEDRYDLVDRRSNLPLEQALEVFEELARHHRHLELYWFPHARTCTLKSLDRRAPDLARSSASRAWLDDTLENSALGLLAGLTHAFPDQVRRLNRVAARISPQGERRGPSYQVFASERRVRFVELEYALPVERGPACLRALGRLLREGGFEVALPVEYRRVAADDMDLSPFQGRDSVTLSVHLSHRASWRACFEACERLLLSQGGRPHWGKLHCLDWRRLRTLFPGWDAFQHQRARLDPQGRFQSPRLCHLLGPAA